MTWGFIWLMLVLKIPIAALLYIVWWAVHQDTEPDGSDGGDGGTKVYPHDDGRRPALPRPRRPRGPHGDPATPAPAPRTRTTIRSRDPERER